MEETSDIIFILGSKKCAIRRHGRIRHNSDNTHRLCEIKLLICKNTTPRQRLVVYKAEVRTKVRTPTEFRAERKTGKPRPIEPGYSANLPSKSDRIKSNSRRTDLNTKILTLDHLAKEGADTMTLARKQQICLEATLYFI